jgi:flagellar FliL protein
VWKYLIIGLVVLAIAVPAGLYFTGVIGGEAAGDTAAAEHVEPQVPPTYLPLDPPFVVNFTHRGTLRYLQVSLELTYRDPALLLKVDERMPEIRNDLILLFSGQDYEQLSTFEGKEHLRAQIMAAINRVIGVEVPAEEHAAATVETGSGPAPAAPAAVTADAEAHESIGEVYITNFVMQ